MKKTPATLPESRDLISKHYIDDYQSSNTKMRVFKTEKIIAFLLIGTLVFSLALVAEDPRNVVVVGYIAQSAEVIAQILKFGNERKLPVADKKKITKETNQ